MPSTLIMRRNHRHLRHGGFTRWREASGLPPNGFGRISGITTTLLVDNLERKSLKATSLTETRIPTFWN